MRTPHDPGTPQRPRLRWADAAWVLPLVLAGHALVLGALLRSEPGQTGGGSAWTALFLPAPAAPTGPRAAGPETAAPRAVQGVTPGPPAAAPGVAGPSPSRSPDAAATAREPDAGRLAFSPSPARGDGSQALAPGAPAGGAEGAPLAREAPVPGRASAEQAPGVAAVGQAAPAPAGGDEPLPTYAVRVPPAFTQGYALRRGGREGRAEMVLARDGSRYAMSLRGWVDGVEVLGYDSRGGFDGAGFAPERFVERQRGRDRLAANFDTARRRVSYSGPAQTHPYAPGTQDRLSWLVQLAAIVGADPARFTPGAELVLAVSGARADLDRWRFEVGAPEALALADGRIVTALPLRREPARPYDLRVQVWLDPANQHLPALVRSSVVPGGAALELLAEPDAAHVPTAAPSPAAPASALPPAASAGGG